ncbi:sensor histidine kinase [Patescibacteria group bacterium]
MISFASPRRKIVIFFALLAGGLVVLATFINMMMVSYELDSRSQETLEAAWEGTKHDFEADGLGEIGVYLQQSSQLSTQLPIMEETMGSSWKDQWSSYLDESKESDRVREYSQVSSRIIDPNGKVTYNSELFDVSPIAKDDTGFRVIETDQSCTYSLSNQLEHGDKAGTTIQVAEYCAFPPSAQRAFFWQMLIVAGIFVFATYLLGLFVAKSLLKPLEKSVEQTRQFSQNCYHELLTPVAVAMSTVEAASMSGDYEKGLESVKEDLQNIHGSLELLSSKAFWNQAKISMEKTDLRLIMNKILHIYKQRAAEKNVRFDDSQLARSAFVRADGSSVSLIFRNLVDNAVKYAKPGSTITLWLDQDSFVITNEVKNINDIDAKQFFERYKRGADTEKTKGYGLGLSIVKELVDIHEWNIEVRKINGQDNKVQVKLTF